MARTSWLRRAAVAATVCVAVAGCGGPAGTPAPRPHNPPASQVQEPPTEVEQAHHGCGVERWTVKTGTDAGAAAVDIAHPQDTTIAALAALPPPTREQLDANPSSRIGAAETTAYRLSGVTLTGYKLEADGDFHLVLTDSAGNTMIAEIPKPACVGDASPWRSAIATTRQAFDAAFPGAETQTSFVRPDRLLTAISGAGFFDFLHGQTGVAPNAIELHAVTGIDFG
jgi:hypothetical protein